MKDPFTWVYELRRSYIPDRLWYAAGFGVAGGSAVLDHVLWATDILGAIALLASAYLAYTYVACKVYGRPLPAVEQAASRVRARMVTDLRTRLGSPAHSPASCSIGNCHEIRPR